ncbi:MAG: hypothetical protein J1F11_06005 [Oscillospiraceae bacterium]|nr:hypothetical protein [Oscillospiraceae bacterium]
MQTFRLIAMTACFLGIVITIFNSLYPSEKFSKQVKIIFSLIFILSIAKPFAAGRITLPEIGETVYASSDYYSSLNDNAYDYFIRSVESNISASLEAKLNEKNIYPEEIQTSINISDSSSISINEVIITIKDMNVSSQVIECITEATEGEAKVTVKEFKDEGNA